MYANDFKTLLTPQRVDSGAVGKRKRDLQILQPQFQEGTGKSVIIAVGPMRKGFPGVW